jgi:hypothetical protein
MMVHNLHWLMSLCPPDQHALGSTAARLGHAYSLRALAREEERRLRLVVCKLVIRLHALTQLLQTGTDIAMCRDQACPTSPSLAATLPVIDPLLTANAMLP